MLKGSAPLKLDTARLSTRTDARRFSFGNGDRWLVGVRQAKGRSGRVGYRASYSRISQDRLLLK